MLYAQPPASPDAVGLRPRLGDYFKIPGVRAPTQLCSPPSRLRSSSDDLIPTEARGKWDLREMRIISMMCPALILAGCTFLNDTPPKVIYQSSDTISVEYSDDGLMRVSNRQEAMEMIERHCEGPYRIVGGSGGRIDAECVR